VEYALAPRTAPAGGAPGLGARGTERVPGFGASALEKARSLGYLDVAAAIERAAGAAAGVAPPPSRILLVTYEYLSPFSGNGQYSRCIVRGLARAGARVLVVSGRPAAEPLAAQDAEARAHAGAREHGVVDVPVPAWGRLERGGCAWEAFAAGAAAPAAAAAVAAFAPTLAAVVDWHGLAAWEALRGGLASPPPMAWLNFRVFSTSTAVHFSAEDAAFYRRAEAAALRAAALSIALCRMDALHLLALALGEDPAAPPPPPHAAEKEGGEGKGEMEERPAPPPPPPPLPALAIVLPPLRSDVAAFAGGGRAPPPPPPMAEAAVAAGCALLTSLVRLSPEKNAAAFPALLSALGAPALAAAGVAPFLVAAGGGAYAEGVLAALARALPPAAAAPPPIVCARYLNAEELGGVLARAAFNVHPSLSEAYGMTIVEAAAWGVPSVVHLPARCGGGGGGGGGAAGGGRAAAAAFSPHPAARGAPGALAVDAAPLLAAVAPAARGRALLRAAELLPPVGACDLLAPSPWEAGEAGVVGVDFSDPAGAAATVAPLLAAAAARARGEAGGGDGGGGDALRAIAATAQRRALSWTEDTHGATLLRMLQALEKR
jgi:hypothetical protein